MTLVPTLGQNVRRLRELNGMKRIDVKKAMNLAPQSSVLADIENDRYKDLSISTILRVAKGLKVSVEDILRGVDDAYDRVSSDLIGPAGVIQGGSTKGVSPDVGIATARLQRLQEDLKFYRAATKRARDLLRRADTILGAEVRASEKEKPASGRPRRRSDGRSSTR